MTESLPALSAVDLRRLIGSKGISPVELLDECIERIERLNPAFNAIAATGYARARDVAKEAEAAVLRGERLGLLHGLPTGVKDLEKTAGLLSTFGSPLFRNHVPGRDTSMVARVRAAGAVIVAKTNTPGFGAGANTRNPVLEQAFAGTGGLRRPLPDTANALVATPALKSIMTHAPSSAASLKAVRATLS